MAVRNSFLEGEMRLASRPKTDVFDAVVIELSAVSRFRTPLLVLLLLFLCCLFGGGVLYLCIGVGEGNFPWLSSATKETIDTGCGFLILAAIASACGLVLVLSWFLRKRGKS